MVAHKQYTREFVTEHAKKLANASPQEVLTWAYRQFHPRLLMACSFGGASGMVLVDMAMKIQKDARIFYIDTDFLFPETYETVQKVEQRYNFKAEVYKPLLTPEQQAEKHGPELWKKTPDECCGLRKVEPNERAMATVDAWITGIRKDQAKTREAVSVVEWDEGFDVVKINPLANWTEDEAWVYVREHKVIVNKLLGQGYKSIGCTHCTRAVKAGEDARAGRWEGFDKVECGLHVAKPKKTGTTQDAVKN